MAGLEGERSNCKMNFFIFIPRGRVFAKDAMYIV